MASALLLGLTTSPASAREPSEALAVQAMQNLGRCIVEQSPSSARDLLARDFRTPEYDQALERFAKGHARCLPGGRMSFGGVLFAGSLAEALLHKQVDAAALPQQLAFDPARPPIASRSESETMALCTAMKAPRATAGLLATKAATDEETASMKALAPVLGECLAKGAQIEMTRPAIRAVLALAGWRIVNSPKAAQ